MKKSHLDFALLSEGRLEFWEALFEMERLSEANTQETDEAIATQKRITFEGSGKRLRRFIAKFFNPVARRMIL